MEFGAKGSGFGAWCLGCGIWGFEFRDWSLGNGVRASEFDSGRRVEECVFSGMGKGCRVKG